MSTESGNDDSTIGRQKYAVNTRQIKSEIQRQLPKKFHSISTSYAALKQQKSGAELSNLDISATLADQRNLSMVKLSPTTSALQSTSVFSNLPFRPGLLKNSTKGSGAFRYLPQIGRSASNLKKIPTLKKVQTNQRSLESFKTLETPVNNELTRVSKVLSTQPSNL